MVAVRVATLDDIGLIDLLQQELAESDRPFDSTIKKETPRYVTLSKIVSIISSKDARVFIAEDGNKPIGMLQVSIYDECGDWAVYKKKGNIEIVFVKGEYRGKEVASELMKKALVWLESRGIDRSQVMTYIQNERALAFYKKHGFRELVVTLVRD